MNNKLNTILSHFYDEHYLSTLSTAYCVGLLQSKAIERAYQTALTNGEVTTVKNSKRVCSICQQSLAGQIIKLNCSCGLELHHSCWVQCVGSVNRFKCPQCRDDMGRLSRITNTPIETMIPNAVPKQDFIEGISKAMKRDQSIDDVKQDWDKSTTKICTNMEQEERQPFQEAIIKVDIIINRVSES